MNYHISISRCLLLLVCFTVMAQSTVSIIKMVVVDRDDMGWSSAVKEIVAHIEQMEKYAPQVFYVKANKSICEIIGKVDRAKLPSDFIVVAKKHGPPLIECDPEWGRVNFAFLLIDTAKVVDNNYDQHVKFMSNESIPTLDIHNFKTPAEFMDLIIQKQWYVRSSRIPDEYKTTAERRQRVKRRIYMAVISLLSLAVVALLVIMFMTSLGRYKERIGAKNKKDSLHSKKKANDTVISADGADKKHDTESKKSRKKSKGKKGENESYMDSVRTADLGPGLIEPKSEQSSKKDAHDGMSMSAKTANGPEPIVKSEKSEKPEDSSKKN